MSLGGNMPDMQRVGITYTSDKFIRINVKRYFRTQEELDTFVELLATNGNTDIDVTYPNGLLPSTSAVNL